MRNCFQSFLSKCNLHRYGKVGSLREQLQRSGVDAAPLAMMVHSLSHAIRKAAAAMSKQSGAAGEGESESDAAADSKVNRDANGGNADGDDRALNRQQYKYTHLGSTQRETMTAAIEQWAPPGVREKKGRGHSAAPTPASQAASSHGGRGRSGAAAAAASSPYSSEASSTFQSALARGGAVQVESS